MRWQEGDWSMEFWDKLYRESQEKYPYDTEGYSDALGIQWGAIVGEDIAIPIAFRRVFGLKTGYLPFGIQQWGPIGRSASSKKHIIKALDSIPNNFKKIDISFHRSLDWGNIHKGWHFKNYRLQRFTIAPNYELELSPGYEKIHGNYSKQIKRNLKSSLKQNLTLFEHDTPDVLIREFKQYQGKRYSISDKFITSLSQVMYHLLHKGKGAVWTLYGSGNHFHAGVFVAFSGNRIVLLFSAVSQEGRDSNAMSQLINELIIFSCGRWEIFDFEGSKESGLSRFYSGFGAQSVPYVRYQRWAIL